MRSGRRETEFSRGRSQAPNIVGSANQATIVECKGTASDCPSRLEREVPMVLHGNNREGAEALVFTSIQRPVVAEMGPMRHGRRTQKRCD